MLRRIHFRLPLSLALAAALVAGAGCASESPTAALASTSTPAVASTSSADATLLECPASTTESATSVIGSLGGVLSVAGATVVIPANAVLAPTSFTLTVPASRYVEIEVTAGESNHFIFSKPVLVSIDYGRCGPNSLLTPHEAWNIDPATKALLEKMAGVDIAPAHTVVFSTIHFSGYALAD